MQSIIKKAFTLIELLVVIAIIGILSGLIIVTMNGVTAKANIAKSQVFSNSLRNALMLNLVSEWKFDGSGVLDGGDATTVYTQDTWGANHGSSITGTLKVYSGNNCVTGSCLYFDGSSYISGGSSLIPSQPFYTIEGWVKIPSSETGGANRYLINLNSGGDAPGFSPCFWTAYKSIIYLNSSNYKYGASDLRDDKWHHVVFVVIGSAMADVANSRIYVDGKLEAAGSVSNSNSPVLPTGNFRI
ncbi:MAG: prepilin-type N-terminal cleavage/methylation domain-containing protein, partial [Candidatus Pacebacteria bacterium]|nr:prepilin-type N-terminal cleavage/methylation domain-containing protein [Candidatus Paceibacterota bacterium]